VGGNPAGLVVNQTNHTAYVADSAAGPVSFFQFEKPAPPTNVSATTARGPVQLAWQTPADGGLPIATAASISRQLGALITYDQRMITEAQTLGLPVLSPA
jgi:hypothetical protein